ncbi:hypothetical protein DH2020_032058 [Rehmannia glutinosa]|uniref:Regulatory protein RecX n=1 Tax=Rehmannia glutinosa TaxID=99300 RepID=A0ABR0VJL4_REHGL
MPSGTRWAKREAARKQRDRQASSRKNGSFGGGERKIHGRGSDGSQNHGRSKSRSKKNIKSSATTVAKEGTSRRIVGVRQCKEEKFMLRLRVREESTIMWHHKLGHMSEQGLKILSECKLLPRLTKKASKDSSWWHTRLNKMEWRGQNEHNLVRKDKSNVENRKSTQDMQAERSKPLYYVINRSPSMRLISKNAHGDVGDRTLHKRWEAIDRYMANPGRKHWDTLKRGYEEKPKWDLSNARNYERYGENKVKTLGSLLLQKWKSRAIVIDVVTFQEEQPEKNVEETSKRCNGIQSGHNRQDVENLAIELLAARAFTALELKKKLQGKRLPLDIVDAVITDFQSSGLINDCLYAETYSQSRWSSSSWAPRRTRQALFKKGISEVDVEKAIKLVFKNEDDGDQDSRIAMSKLSIDQLYVQASKQWRRSCDAPEETRKSRLVRWLQYRGFNWSVINYVLKKLESQNPSS